MSNDTAKTITTNIVPVQGTFEPLPPYECINLIGPAGTPFYAPINPILDGVSITNSTINSTTIGVTTPALAAFTSASSTNQPVGNNDLTTKLYVDSLALGISWKQPVVAATLSNITLSGAQTIDTVSVVAGDRVLVKNQSTQANNGIYIVGTPWTRSPDADLWDELVSALVFVESGSQAGSAWYCPVQPGGTLGVTAITWNNFSVGGVYFAGTGLNLSGGDTFNISNTTVAAASYGSGSAVGTFTVNAQGQLTAASNTNIAIAASQITSGTIDSARLSGSYSGITGVGTLTDLTVSNTIVGSISGNAATATTATSATTATTATNIAGGATGSIPYQSGAGATTFLAAGSNGQVLTLAGGVPTYATPTTGTVTSVSTAGTVNGLTLTGGPITGSGTVTLGGTLDLSAPPTIGNTTANTGAFTTLSGSTSVTTPIVQATNSGGLALRNSAGTTQIGMGAGGGDNVSINVSTNLNGTNAQIDISPTGTGHVHIKPTGSGSLEIAPTNAGTINNMSIGGTTAAAAKVTTLDITSTLALAGSTGTAGYVLTSNGASAPTWQANASGLAIVDDTTTNATRYLTFTDATTGNITTGNVSSSKLTFNPSTGTLGIGTSTPSSYAFGLAIDNTNATSTGYVINLLSSGSSWFKVGRLAASSTAIIQSGQDLSLQPDSGKVGIGTSSPSTALQVNGTVTATTFSGALSNALTAGTGLTATATYNGSAAITFDATGTTINSKTSGYTLLSTDAGKTISITTGGVTIPTAVMAAGNIVSIYNNSSSSQTITQGSSLTLQFAGQSSSTTGNRTLGLYGLCTIVFISSSNAVITGSGLT